MTIKELMSLELFKTCKLLTGDIGLTNEVDSAMVLEALDIENWSKKKSINFNFTVCFQRFADS
jgi:purine catabolism regulator